MHLQKAIIFITLDQSIRISTYQNVSMSKATFSPPGNSAPELCELLNTLHMDRITVYEDKNLRLEIVSDGNYLQETWWGVTLKDAAERLFTEISKALREK